MRVNELLVEARRNPHLNPKVDALSALSIHYNNKNKFVSYTKLPKLGVNPNTTHKTTPIGVYGYPIKYMLDRAYKIGTTFGATPFASDTSPYVIGFSLKGKILNTRADPSREDIERGSDYIYKAFGNNSYDAEEEVERWEEATDFGKLYESVRETVLRMSRRVGKRATIMLTDFLTKGLGYDAVVDNGLGHIHPNEPHQCVALSTRAIYDIEIHDNVPISGREEEEKAREIIDMLKQEEKRIEREYPTNQTSPEQISNNALAIQRIYRRLFNTWRRPAEKYAVSPSVREKVINPEFQNALRRVAERYKKFYEISGDTTFREHGELMKLSRAPITFTSEMKISRIF